ncbi:MAG: hypothetical protein ACKOXF_02490 [Chitinophagaceae bacterium]
MKKLIYSGLVAFVAAAVMTGCGDDGTGGGTTTGPVGPSIEFQTNTGTFSGYTFANGSAEIGTVIKIGSKISHSGDVNLKSTKMTVKYNNQAEQLVGTDSIISGNTKTCNRDYTFTLPQDKGTYVFTVYATDKNATTKSASITIQAYGPLSDRGTGHRIYSLKSVNFFSAFDLLTGEAITAASGSGNEALRDIVDGSNNTALSKTWNSGNGTQFVMSGADGKLNGKVFSQFLNESDIIAAWDATSGKSSTITGVDINKLIIAKSTRNGNTFYYLIGIDDVQDNAGSEDDYYEFHYVQN